jgi:cytochrome c biogenesis protein CcmG, thiol:disulfide interchange protein DsbE
MTPLSQPEEPKPSDTAKERIKAALISTAIVVVAVAVYWFVLRVPPSAMPNPEVHAGVGSVLPYLELSPLTGDGSPVSLPDLQDRVTLLNFWGTWCRPCRDELPHIAQLRRRFAGRESFRLLAVSCPAGGQAEDVQSLKENTAALLKKLDLDVPTYQDLDGATEFAVRKLIGDEGFPTTVLLDRRGAIRAVWVGYRPGVETEMERYIGVALEEIGRGNGDASPKAAKER